jgi:hypothetical protein
MYNKIELQTKYNLIHEKEWIGEDTVTDICMLYQMSRKIFDLSSIIRTTNKFDYICN